MESVHSAVHVKFNPHIHRTHLNHVTTQRNSELWLLAYIKTNLVNKFEGSQMECKELRNKNYESVHFAVQVHVKIKLILTCTEHTVVKFGSLETVCVDKRGKKQQKSSLYLYTFILVKQTPMWPPHTLSLDCEMYTLIKQGSGEVW